MPPDSAALEPRRSTMAAGGCLVIIVDMQKKIEKISCNVDDNILKIFFRDEEFSECESLVNSHNGGTIGHQGEFFFAKT